MTNEKAVTQLARKIQFDVKGTFQSYYAAVDWCEEYGYSVGSMERDNPIGVMRGDFRIAKWTNMTKAEQDACDATLTSTDFRDGTVTLIFRQNAEVPA